MAIASTLSLSRPRVLLAAYGLVALCASLDAGLCRAQSITAVSERISVTAQDEQFLRSAHPLAEASLAAARLAIVKAESEPLRKLGRDIIADQTTANEELKRLASQHGIALPQGLAVERKKALTQLERASGPAFDREYLKQQKEDSDATLKLFQQQIRLGSGPFKTYAETTLPRLQEHYKLLGGR